MVTTPEEYPLWSTPQPIIVQRNRPHKYIYSLFEGKRVSRYWCLPCTLYLFSVVRCLGVVDPSNTRYILYGCCVYIRPVRMHRVSATGGYLVPCTFFLLCDALVWLLRQIHAIVQLLCIYAACLNVSRLRYWWLPCTLYLFSVMRCLGGGSSL